jgi:hypothetical protein
LANGGLGFAGPPYELESDMPRSVLIDNSILSHGEFAKPISVELPGFGNRLALIEAKAEKDEWLRTHIEALPTIAHLARNNAIELYSYIELHLEHMRGARFPGNALGNVFGKISIASVAPPIDRSLFIQTEIAEFISNKSQTEFCEWLIEVGSELLMMPKLLERLREPQRAALKNLQRYREICHSLSAVQYIDAWHVWTGELNGIESFLTTDKKFVNALSSNKKLVLTCTPIYPEDLLVELGVPDREPIPFQYGRRYYISGAPYD